MQVILSQASQRRQAAPSPKRKLEQDDNIQPRKRHNSNLGRQTQRENCPADTPEIYYRRVIGIPYLDDVLSGMEARFSRLTSTAIQALKLVPAFVQSATFDEIKHFVDFYHTDLPSPSTMPSELRLWQKTCESMLSKPETVAGALKVCCKTDFPNISVILKIIATMG
ncbi:unnamed protein product [Mytilus edulis]|uniref:Uncharacterized protein n=1 Tax=Mytilus edulis TaxID=6550 RepID=A0A8S3QU35_MYTED|nr:unnamed protein product [Mytilus edulis]